MAESLGVALLELGTDDRKLKKGLGRAERSAKKTAGRIKKVFAGIATAALVTGLKRAFDTAIDRLDNIAKSADKIGIATDALQELRVAADLSGISSQALDTALRKFSRSVDEASQDVIEYKEVFDRLGISVTDARDEIKPITQLIGEVADAMGKVGNTTSQAAIALDLFGRSGLDMLNLFQGGAEGIDDLRRAARELGIIFDEKLIREAVIAKDELTLLAKVIEFDMTVALRQLSPLIIFLGELLVWVSTLAGNAAEAFRRIWAGEFFAEEIDNITESLEEQRAVLAQLDADLVELGKKDKPSFFLRVKVGVTLKDTFDEALGKVAIFREALESEIRALENRLSQIGGGFRDVLKPPVVPDPPKPIDDDDAADERQDIIDGITDSIKSQIESLNEQTVAFNLQGGALAKSIALSRANNELKAEGIELSVPEQLALDKNIETLGATADRLIEVADAHRRAEDAALDHTRMIERWSDSIADAVLDVRDLESALASFQNLLMQFLSQQASSGLSDLFTQIAGSIAGALGGGADVFSNAAGQAGTSVTGTSSVASFAHGGSFTVGGRGGVDRNLVKFRASRGENVEITPAGKSSGKTVVNIFTPPGSTVETERKQVGDIEELNFIIDTATARNMRPGTQTNRALRAVYGSRQTLIER